MGFADALAGPILVRWVRAAAPRHPVLGDREARERLEAALSAHPGRRLVLYYWIEDVLPMVLTDTRFRGGSGHWARGVRFVCDDTIGGRVAERLLAGLGRETVRLRWKNPMERIRDLQSILRSGSPLGIAVDGHGPYGRVGEGFARLASSARAVALPLAAVPARVRHLRANALLAVPRRSSPIAIALGDPIAAPAEGTPATSVFEAGLGRARERALALLRDHAAGSAEVAR